MPQSNVIFAYLAVAFVIFITMRGELRLYLGFLLATPAQSPSAPAPTAATPTQTGSNASTAFDLASAASTAAEFLPMVL